MMILLFVVRVFCRETGVKNQKKRIVCTKTEVKKKKFSPPPFQRITKNTESEAKKAGQKKTLRRVMMRQKEY